MIESHVVSMKRLRQALCFAALVGFAGLGWVFSDKGRARHAVFTLERITTPEEVSWSPDDRPAWHRVDDAEHLAPFREAAKDLELSGTTFEQATRLMVWIAGLGPGDLGGPIMSDPHIATGDPYEIYTELRDRTGLGNCAHYAFTFGSIAQAIGIESRTAGMEGEGWINGVGHAINEVYLPETGNWALIDPQNNIYFLDPDGEPLSLLGLREYILSGHESDVRMVHGDSHGASVSWPGTARIYRENIQRITYDARDDRIERYAKVYGSPLAKIVGLEKWPRMLRRLFENVIWKYDARMLYVDDPQYDFFFPEKWIYRVSALLCIGSLCALLLTFLVGRSRFAAFHDSSCDE